MGKPIFTPNPQRRADLIAICDFVRASAVGARLSWLEVEAATGVSMRGQYGRNLFRSACHKESRRYLTLPGLGVEMSSPDNALEIAGRSLEKVGEAISKHTTVAGDLVTQHVAEMRGDEAKQLIRIASISSTLGIVRKGVRELTAPMK